MSPGLIPPLLEAYSELAARTLRSDLQCPTESTSATVAFGWSCASKPKAVSPMNGHSRFRSLLLCHARRPHKNLDRWRAATDWKCWLPDRGAYRPAPLTRRTSIGSCDDLRLLLSGTGATWLTPLTSDGHLRLGFCQDRRSEERRVG